MCWITDARTADGLAAHAAALIVIAGCGAQVVIEESDETGPPPAATTDPETPDPCAAFTGRKSCCDAGCRIIRSGPGSSALVCLSEDRDCAQNPEVCGLDEVCEVHQTPGDGGCSYGLDVDTVGRCVSR